MRQDRSAALAALSLAFDGPLPRDARDAALNGGKRRLGELRDQTEGRHLDRRALACLARIAESRGAADAESGEMARLRALSLALREAVAP